MVLRAHATRLMLLALAGVLVLLGGRRVFAAGAAWVLTALLPERWR